MAEIKKEYTSTFINKQEEKRLVYGIVLEPETIDSQGDVISAEEIEMSAHQFMAQSRMIGNRHREKADARVVESYIAPENLVIGGEAIKPGSWVMAIKILTEDLWERVKNGEYTGFSVGGYGIREEV